MKSFKLLLAAALVCCQLHSGFGGPVEHGPASAADYSHQARSGSKHGDDQQTHHHFGSGSDGEHQFPSKPAEGGNLPVESPRAPAHTKHQEGSASDDESQHAEHHGSEGHKRERRQAYGNTGNWYGNGGYNSYLPAYSGYGYGGYPAYTSGGYGYGGGYGGYGGIYVYNGGASPYGNVGPYVGAGTAAGY